MIQKVFKIVVFLIVLIFVIIYFLFVNYTSPKSNKDVLALFSNSLIVPKLTQEKYKDFNFRKISIKKDTTLPTIVFIHGTIGSLTNFTRYLGDSVLQKKANMIAYDRIGYNYEDKNNTQESIAFERDLLKSITKEVPNNKLIIVGYSYGGPIALACQEKIKRIILLAPAVYSEVEPIPWALNLYKWKLTNWLVPKVWKQASKEKMSHKRDLLNFEKNWQNTKNDIICVHGKDDWIVPFKNSEILKERFKKNQLKLISIKEKGHDLVWSDYKFIKQQILNVLD